MPLPNLAPDGALGKEKKSLLSPIGDPVGQVLNTAVKPVGHVLGKVGNPTGEALQNTEKQAKLEITGRSDEDEKRDEEPGGERIGGNEQTGANPLGL